MIYWYTGQPGHGKTLQAINKALEFQKKGRIVYVCNVRDFDYAKTGMLEMKPEQFRGLAALIREYCGGHARTTVGQNIVLRWVRDESLYEVFQRLNDLGLADIGSQTITDVVSCPGTDSCKLGITSSMGLNAAIQQRVELMDITDPLTKKIHIKMSGCPNSCSRPYLAEIALVGKAPGKYNLYLGAHAGGTRLNAPYKETLNEAQILDALKPLFARYKTERVGAERFGDFVVRAGIVREIRAGREFQRA